MKRFLFILACLPAFLLAHDDAPSTVDECSELARKGAFQPSGWGRVNPETRKSIKKLKGALEVSHPVYYGVKVAAIQGLLLIAEAHPTRYKEDIKEFLRTLRTIYSGNSTIIDATESALTRLS